MSRGSSAAVSWRCAGRAGRRHAPVRLMSADAIARSTWGSASAAAAGCSTSPRRGRSECGSGPRGTAKAGRGWGWGGRGRWARWVGSRRLPSADTVGRVLNRLELAEQRQLVTALNRQGWRRQAVHGRPGGGEGGAGRRLVARVVETYGRLLDVITADALYLEAPFIRTVLDAGKHVVVVLKQEARELYQDADGLRAMQAPTVREE